MTEPKYTLTELLPHIYRLHFESPYQLAMHFLRLQEFYESPKFADQIFTLVDYMEWYAESVNKMSFTYPADWSGFNIPSWVMEKVYGQQGSTNIPDFNKYDFFMRNLFNQLDNCEAAGSRLAHSYYLIGTSNAGRRGNSDVEGVLDHELAHGLYYTSVAYKQDMEQHLDKLPTQVYEDATRILKKAGYHERTVRDEVHAYASTGPDSWGLQEVLSAEVVKPFVTTFQWHKSMYDLAPK